MKKIIILAVLAVMLAGCSSVAKIAKYTVCFGEDPKKCFDSYVETITYMEATK